MDLPFSHLLYWLFQTLDISNYFSLPLTDQNSGVQIYIYMRIYYNYSRSGGTYWQKHIQRWYLLERRHLLEELRALNLITYIKNCTWCSLVIHPKTGTGPLYDCYKWGLAQWGLRKINKAQVAKNMGLKPANLRKGKKGSLLMKAGGCTILQRLH